MLYSDSAHIKANANKRKFLLQHVPVSTRSYMQALDAAVEANRESHGKKALRARKEMETETREIKVSTTDPDAGYMVREGKPEGFFYLDHRTVDGTHNFSTDVHVTPATVHDTVPYLSRLERQQAAFGFEVAAVALDAGYLTIHICHGLDRQGIFAVIGHRRFQHTKGLMPRWKFKYDRDTGLYRYPGGSVLPYRTTNREGHREYKSDPQVCKDCLLRAICTRSTAMQKTVTRHVWEDARERIRANRLTPHGKAIYNRRKETIERSFADGKELYGLRYARYLGLATVREQCLLSVTAQNIKKLALLLDRQSRRAFTA